MTQRIEALKPEAAEGKTRELYAAVKTKLGRVPNLMKTLGNSSAALEGYLALGGALENGELSAGLREQIALTVAEANGCEYCLSAHSAIGKMVGLAPEAIAAARRARADDARTAAALQFARRLVETRGRVEESDVANVRAAGFSAGAVMEIIVHVALNVLTNYVNIAAQTEVDFPRAAPISAAA